MEESDRFNIYRQIKQDHNRESYLHEINIAKFRRIFTRLRFGIINIGYNNRFFKTHKSQMCRLCNTVEDEDHFILKCPKFHDLRRKYIAGHWITLNNVSYKDIITSGNVNMTRGLSMYGGFFYSLRREHRD